MLSDPQVHCWRPHLLLSRGLAQQGRGSKASCRALHLGLLRMQLQLGSPRIALHGLGCCQLRLLLRCRLQHTP